MARFRIGIVDSGVNPWHSHVRGRVSGCRIFVAPDGSIREDGDFRDSSGHGTAVAGVIRDAFPAAEIFAVRVFAADDTAYPSLVARAILRAAACACDFVNLSLSVAPGPASGTLAAACAAAIDAGCVLVASARPDRPGSLPASLPGVYAVSADDTLEPEEVRDLGSRKLVACGRPRDLQCASAGTNFSGHSFACPRGLVHLARQRAVSRSARNPACAARRMP